MTACVTVWTLVRVCVYRPLHPGWSPVHPRLLPAGCAALSASPAPTAPTWTHDDTPPPAGRSEKEMANMRMRKTKKLCWRNTVGSPPWDALKIAGRGRQEKPGLVRVYSALNTDSRGLATIAISLSVSPFRPEKKTLRKLSNSCLMEVCH